jgi:tetratricopeptide (TPR) repeat protein
MAEPFEAEIKKHTEALAADPNSRAFVPLSDVYRKLGRYDEAIVVAREGLVRHPNYLGGKVALARALFENGDLAESGLLLEEVLNFAPDNLLANRLLAQVYLQAGAREKALPLLKRLQAVDPGDAWVAKELARPAPEAPRPKPAPAAAPKAPVRTATLAELYRSQGHDDQALEIYRELLRADPKNPALVRSVRELTGKALTAAPAGRGAILERLLARVTERRRKAA